MRFDSFTFGILMMLFVPIWYGPLNFTVKKIILLLTSCLFYGMWDFRYLPLILGLGFVDYLMGILMAKGQEPTRKTALFLSTATNLTALFMFKYYVWIVNDFFGVTISGSQLAIFGETPLALSFTVFISISYIFDLYRKKNIVLLQCFGFYGDDYVFSTFELWSNNQRW